MPIVLANTARTVGYILAAVVILGFAVYWFANYRAARREVGSEIELAPNRKPYYDDEELETTKLDRTLGMGLGMLALIAVALPLYWLAEPGRQQGAVEGWSETFIDRGAAIYEEQCAQCHGPEGVGGVASFTLTDADGNFVEQVEWQAPALDTVLTRYSKEEVTFVLNYGRANTPMPAWGAPGGGPLTTQQLEELVAYMEHIQLSPEEIAEERDGQVEEVCAPDDAGVCTAPDAEYATLGETMFNLGENGFAGGAYSCARCHTKGWSYGQAEEPGGGFLGPNLTNGATLRQFPTFEGHVGFITEGAQQGQAYGSGGLSGAGQMPGFGFNPNAEQEDSTLVPEQFMYSQRQIEAVVEYERSL